MLKRKKNQQSTQTTRISRSNKCEICGEVTPCEVHHVMGGTARQISDKYGAVVHCCRACHSKIHHNPAEYSWLKAETQKRVMQEQGWTLEDWMKHFYKNYMEDP